jgi:hypothetical protein
LAGKPGTAGEGLKRSTKDLKLAIYGSCTPPCWSHNLTNVCQNRLRMARLFRHINN